MSGGSPRAQAKRLQIVTAARTLFLADGYARTSMDAVTAEAAVSKQTLYAYFPGKEELLKEVIGVELDGLSLEAAEVEVHSVAELGDFLEAGLGAVLNRLLQPEAVALLRLIVGEASGIAALRDVFREALPLQVLNGLTRLLTRVDASGVARVPRPDLSARMLLGPVMSFVALDGWLSPDPPRPPAKADVRLLIDMFLRTLDRGDQE